MRKRKLLTASFLSLTLACGGEIGEGKKPVLTPPTGTDIPDDERPSGVEGDINGDGVLDAVGATIDADGDGKPDEIDVNGDGKPDGIGIDIDGDGIADGVGIDTDDDGLIDAIDTNGDGSPEVTSSPDRPSAPGVFSTIASELPGSAPTACEWEWTIRTLTYNPSAATPRRMYTASCDEGPLAKMFVAGAVGENAPHPDKDPTSGYVMVAQLDDASGKVSRSGQRLFDECLSMHGIAVSPDCQTIGVLCRIPSKAQGFDKDVLATHPAADWMTNPYVCGDKLNDEMWLFEWTNGDITSEPKRYIVHKSIGSWEYGNNYLRLGNDGDTWGIGVKATVGGKDGSGCHEADAFVVMDRVTEKFTTRGWSWACGTGHTLMNRVAHDATTGKFAALCSTDYNEKQVGGLGAYYFRMEDGEAQEFHYLNLDGIKNKGGASSIVPRTGGGFLGIVVGVPGDKTPEGYPADPPTQVGLVKWNAEGIQQGPIKWIAKDATHYLSYTTLSVLGRYRYLLGYGVMGAVGDTDDTMRVPSEYWLVEIDENGNPLTKPLKVDGAGWGELDEMAPLGQARAGWAYIDEPAYEGQGPLPACNQNKLELSVYTSPVK